MNNTPKGMRLHIGLFGRRNVGKSSLLNALTHRAAAIVSDEPGTTTDPVEQTMELQPIGPVVFIDTAGFDDVGALGAARVERTRRMLDRTELALLVTDEQGWGHEESALLRLFKDRATPVLAVFNKADRTPEAGIAPDIGTPYVRVSARTGEGMDALREAMIRVLPEDALTPSSIVADLVPPGEAAVLVVPIDKEAPKGRLILPQVQTIRDLLDHDAYAVVVKERELKTALDRLHRPPALVVTDSQAFLKVAADTPPEVPMTSFSILFARWKGDLVKLVEGARAIERLRTGARVLVAEACAHHPITEDIGRVKIPRWLTQYVGGALRFDHVQGEDFPEDLSPYSLVVHCGSCVYNRKLMLTRILRCERVGVPITNYGVAIAYALGVLERALRPFPAAHARLR